MASCSMPNAHPIQNLTEFGVESQSYILTESAQVRAQSVHLAIANIMLSASSHHLPIIVRLLASLAFAYERRNAQMHQLRDG